MESHWPAPAPPTAVPPDGAPTDCCPIDHQARVWGLHTSMPDYMTGLENSELARGTNPGICNGEILYLQEGVLTHQRLSVDNVPPAECQPTWPTGKCPSAALQTGCLLFGHKHMDVTCGSPGSSRDSPGQDAAQMDDHLCEILTLLQPLCKKLLPASIAMITWPLLNCTKWLILLIVRLRLSASLKLL